MRLFCCRFSTLHMHLKFMVAWLHGCCCCCCSPTCNRQLSAPFCHIFANKFLLPFFYDVHKNVPVCNAILWIVISVGHLNPILLVSSKQHTSHNPFFLMTLKIDRSVDYGIYVWGQCRQDWRFLWDSLWKRHHKGNRFQFECILKKR